ncbi:hypothetical protein D3C71_1310380 [compost metagenome]
MLFLFRQTNPRQLEITQGVIDRFLLGDIQLRVVFTVAQIAIRVVQPLVLADPGAVLREQRQGLFVGFAQFRAVFHRVQVAHRRENTAKHIIHFCQLLAQIVPGVRRALRNHALYRFATIIQRLSYSRDNVFREDFRKGRQRKRRE